MSKPHGVAVDPAGNLYVSDSEAARIRRVTSDGIITTVAGNRVSGYSGDGGPATNAMLNVPNGVAVDAAGNLYIADRGNYRVRKVSFFNQPPIAICRNATVAAGPACNASASIDNGSWDSDGDFVTLTQVPAGPYSLASTNVTLTAADNRGGSSQCQGTVTVNDATPPAITGASVDKPVLWPPNHKMVDVVVSYGSADNCCLPVCTLTVTSNEPANGTGDGDTAPDWEVFDAHRVRLRAERAGNGNGRVYTILIACTDASGNRSTKTVTVSVPHSRGN